MSLVLYMVEVILYFALFCFFVDLASLSLLLCESGQRFVNFIYPFNEPAIGFVDIFLFLKKSLFYWFPLWYLWYLWFPSFCWLKALFKILLGGSLGCWFEIFLFLCVEVPMNFPLRTTFSASHRFCMLVFLLFFASRYF